MHTYVAKWSKTTNGQENSEENCGVRKYYKKTNVFFLISALMVYSESTKQMEQTLRAKVKIFFKSENLKKCF